MISSIVTLADEVLKTSAGYELTTLAINARKWAFREKEHVAPLIGADAQLVAALLGVPADTPSSIVSADSSNVSIHCSMRDGHCRGVYIVGNARETRVLNAPGQVEAATRALSMAVGHPVSLPDASQAAVTGPRSITSWSEGKIPVVARWLDSQLIELYVGDLSP